MTKLDWIAIGEALGELRIDLKGDGLPRDAHASAAHDRKLIYFTQLATIERVAHLLAETIAARCVRFDRPWFLRLTGVKR